MAQYGSGAPLGDVGAGAFVNGDLLQKVAPLLGDNPTSASFLNAMNSLHGETLGGLLAAPHLLATDLVIACFALVLAGMAAVVPLLILSIASLVLAVRIPAAAAACGGCLLIAALLAGAVGMAGRPWALGIIGREFGSR